MYVTRPRHAPRVPLARIVQVLLRLVSRLTPRKLVTRMRPLPMRIRVFSAARDLAGELPSLGDVGRCKAMGWCSTAKVLPWRRVA